MKDDLAVGAWFGGATAQSGMVRLLLVLLVGLKVLTGRTPASLSSIGTPVKGLDPFRVISPAK
jgi:hypothetical protein